MMYDYLRLSFKPTEGTLLPGQRQSISYTAFNKVSHVSQRGYDYFITYGPDRLRRKTRLISGITDETLLTKYFAFGDYEKETNATATRHLHYISAGDGLAAVYVKNENAADSLYFIMKDHLGSITGAINAESGKVYRQNFDAWGRKRNPENWTYDDIPEYFPLERGFTGHEHLKWFGLINMNGRMYDASLCRFLSPDPYVQMPDYSQNFNRYSYALNNPLVYTDPSGEFFLGTIFTGVIDFFETVFIDGGIDPWNTPENRGEAWSDFDPTAEWSKTNKAWKIDIGGFKTDPNRTFAGRGLQLFSRWTWELPQTALGKGYSHTSNIVGAVDRVDYFGGATFVTRTNQDSRWGISLGNYINVSISDDIDGSFEERVVSDPLFMHEYGHTFDSQIFGISYLLAIGIPSLMSASSASQVDGEPYGVTTHDFRWYEMSANRHASRYFSKHFGVSWLSLYRSGTIETYYPRRRR
ncbi:MAG: RHS repeat-associated core domain-containing protein [Bacteroidales bacterium]|nr:RHS repeat-associated core domain-containing protein [Bacteroidales bacterium]